MTNKTDDIDAYTQHLRRMLCGDQDVLALDGSRQGIDNSDLAVARRKIAELELEVSVLRSNLAGVMSGKRVPADTELNLREKRRIYMRKWREVNGRTKGSKARKTEIQKLQNQQ